MTTMDDEALAREVEKLPPASTMQGEPGHDTAMMYARGAQLLAWRSAGLTYDQIAKQAGYSDAGTARQALIRALDRHESDSAEHLRIVENTAYDTDQRTLRAIISDVNVPVDKRIRAIDARTRSAARHARMNGLDAPQQISVTPTTRIELEEAVHRFRQIVLGTVVDVTDEPYEEGDLGGAVAT